MNLFFIGEIGEWVDGSFWSIAVEVKFYLLVALLAGMFEDSDKFTKMFCSLALVMGPIWAASTLFEHLGSGAVTPQSMLKFLAIAPYLSFFAVGIVGRRLEAGAEGAGRLLAANVALSTAIVWIEAYSFELGQGWIVASICALAYLVLVAMFVRFALGRPLPFIPGLSPAVARIGLLSFSWYLIHENVGISMLAYLDIHLPAQVALVIVLVATFVLAVGFAALFEWRFRKPVERVASKMLDWIGQRADWLSPLRSTRARSAGE